ncbi:ComEC/Rec2 family competence protein [Tenacibaculum aestuariivivum]|uniref:ComEC/Rec2 family competence protein n=1 Tax=Tenacibaculum aestuariivivum TaxID=2006131 RepID=UPI003AB33E21
MKKLLQYLPFHFLICIIIGIIIQFYTNIWHYNFSYLALILLTLTGILFLLKKKVKAKIYYTIITNLLFVFIGISTTFIHNPKNYDSYYKHHITDNSSIVLQIHKVLKSGNYNHKYIVDVIQIDTKKTVGTILLNLKKDSISSTLKVDDLIFTKTEFKKLRTPLNPYQFDYSNYLSKKYVYQQVFINSDNYQKLIKNNTSIYGLSEKIRNKIKTSLKKYNFNKNELSVINALLLGERKDISKSLIQSYTNAGAIHILAISGLHIGILLLMLSYLLKPIERLKNGLLIKSLFLIILLWMFAFIAGLSASVVRAVTMFTFIAIGDSFKKKKIVEYSLISSMFFLLLIKPLFLFDVGFQLSYMAVFGIIWIQPMLYKIWDPKFWLLNKFWSLLTVSIAAQIGILPISLYYFHQFPVLFIISNLLIIPFLGSILMGGIIIIFLALLKIPIQVLFDFYGFIISLMNKIVDWVAKQEEFLLQEIPMSFHEIIIWYIIIVFSYQYITCKKVKHILFLLITIIALQTVTILEKKDRETKQEFIVFNKNRKNMIGIRNGNKLQVFHNLENLTTASEKSIKAYRIHENIASNFCNKIPNIIYWNKEKILIIDSLGIYNIGIKNPIVILQNSPKINLNRLITILKPKQVIADASNYNSSINNWQITCNKHKTPFYHTSKNGAYSINKTN